jgi:hypothetical protein
VTSRRTLSNSTSQAVKRYIEERDVIKVDKDTGISVVNPATAYNVLSGFVDLKPGDRVV